MNIKGWASWTARHPQWVLYQARQAVIHGLKTPRHNSCANPASQPLDEALADVLRCPAADVRNVLAEYRDSPIARPSTALPERWSATDTLASACYAACRLLRPSLVIEAGSGAGFSAAAILKALSVNDHGRLISVELPRLGTKDFSYVGTAVPESLRSRWTVHFGPSLQVLEKVVPKGEQVDVFLHDSDHSYWNQCAEYAFALSRFGDQGLLISDDVRNPSFLEAAGAHGLVPVLVEQPPKKSPIGLMSCAFKAAATPGRSTHAAHESA